MCSRHGPAKDFAAAGITAQEFKKEPGHSVQHEKGAHHLPIEFSAVQQPAQNEEIRDFDGESYVMERGLVADLAIIHAWKADREGNLVYRKTARNFNPVMATAAKVTVAEVEHLVEPGIIDPDHIHTPGIFVKRIVRCPSYEKRIEQRTVRKRGN